MSGPAHCRRSAALALVLATGMAFSGVAHAQGIGPGGASDPFEHVNRGMFRINNFLDRVLLRPIAMTYRRFVPRVIRQGLNNAVTNLGEPSVFVNDVLQGHGKKAVHTVVRFAGNSTFGLLGLVDVAGKSGLPHHDNDFGLTMARYGVKAGPYFFVPLIGPTTLRDGLGKAADLSFDPLIYSRFRGQEEIGVASVVVGGLQARVDADKDLKTLETSATDPYATLRSFYLQSRYAQVTGHKLDIESLPDFDEAPQTQTPPSSAAPLPAPSQAAPPQAAEPPAGAAPAVESSAAEPPPPAPQS